ncbi:uncharacterized protein APUU_11782A [Aspergillus puulaauensis]|uniref:N-acetyltransferase domain-containing protein n=1 Tax=Aspergillus puulaauensis TaxID=1220207 RepID=A0A7R8AGT0_9EURO|nr:uncharacterized protein APUU_11782A [Aspergillus puulaauensis]BCS18954.1 hypothetical protein APUU_11782A [Aspergillus puulaauensis]
MSKTVNFAGLSSQDITAFVRPLSVADVPSCVEVESAFPEPERCSREKFIYRLTVCPEPCLGLFIEKRGNPETETPQLIAHVIGNRVSANRVTDSSMNMPEKWQERNKVTLDSNGGIIGNDSAGRFIGVHSVAVRTEYQGKGLGRDLLKEYAKYVRESIKPADSIVLIAHGHLLRFYESVGFKNLGPSPCEFAGGGWYDMELVV